MDTGQMIQKIARQENKPEWYIKAEMQKAMDMADWSQLSTDGKQPASFEAAFNLIVKRVQMKK